MSPATMSASTPAPSKPANDAPSLFQIPRLFLQLIAPFPLVTYPPARAPDKRAVLVPTLWIHAPLSTTPDTTPDLLSHDVECLKWQAHLALRGVRDVTVRWDVRAAGALGGRLPNLQVPSARAPDVDGELLAAHNIPTWVIEQVGGLGELEGYADAKARDESLAWIALLEGDVHAALVRVTHLCPPAISSDRPKAV
jgi:metaxin